MSPSMAAVITVFAIASPMPTWARASDVAKPLWFRIRHVAKVDFGTPIYSAMRASLQPRPAMAIAISRRSSVSVDFVPIPQPPGAVRAWSKTPTARTDRGPWQEPEG